MGISEKVAYLKGLAEGMSLDVKSKEGKLLLAVIDVLDDMAEEMLDMQELQMDLEAGLDAVSEDLEDLEYVVFDEFDDEFDDDDEEDEKDDCYATTCPSCEEEIYFDESVLEDGEVICHNCGERLEFDFSELEGKCDCGDDCDCDAE